MRMMLEIMGVLMVSKRRIDGITGVPEVSKKNFELEDV
jgi:hypothetical protein